MSVSQIYKSNALIEAQYRLSVAEQRIMYACISQVRRDQPITDDILYSISANEIAEMSGTSTKQAYRELEKAALRLKRRDVRLVQEPNGQGQKQKVMITGWASNDYLHQRRRASRVTALKRHAAVSHKSHRAIYELCPEGRGTHD